MNNTRPSRHAVPAVGHTGKMPVPLAVVAVGLLAVLAPEAAALINPNFTPVHLVEQSELILSVELTCGAGGAIAVRVAACLKGKAPQKPPALDLTKTPAQQAEALRKTIGAKGKKPALLFSGKYREQTADGDEPLGDDAGDTGAVGLLHVQGRWFRLYQKQRGAAWMPEALDERMQAVWAGGTDMLGRAVKYVLSDPDAAVPARTGATWGSKIRPAELKGKVRGLLAVDLRAARRKPPCLHVLCDRGDRLLAWNAAKRAFADVTADRKLTATSHAAAWGDLDADGRLDLACWDGRGLRVLRQTPAGTFEARGGPLALPGGCIGLDFLGAGPGGKVALVVSTPAAPLLVVPGPDGSLAARAIAAGPSGATPPPDLGRALPCLVADLDGDRRPDLLQPREKGAVLYKAAAAGTFTTQVCREVATGKGPAGAFLGDFDADGLLDVFAAAERRCFLWQNLGAGQFVEALELTGEAAYITKPGGLGGCACDVNNDGRQDLMIFYADRPPQLFFNRGFRSFGHSHALDVEENELLPAAGKGQQAALVADLDGDGGQDLAVALANGQVWVLFRDVESASALCVRAAPAPAGRSAGPIAVTAWAGRRCLGAWNVAPGGAGAFFGRLEPGLCTLRWQWPGGKAREKKLPVVDRPVRFELPAE